MSRQVHALNLTVLRWEEDQSAEDYIAELDAFDLGAWDSTETLVQFVWAEIEYVYRGGAVLVFGQSDGIFTLTPSQVDTLLASEDATKPHDQNEREIEERP